MMYRAENLKAFTVDVLQALDVPAKEANVVAEGLIRADLEGLDSHGISRLGVYAARLKDKRINARPRVTTEAISKTVLLVNGDNGLGHVASYHGLKEGIKLAREYGLAAVGVHSSNHFGTAAYFCQLAASEEMMTIVCTNSPPGMAPWGGKSAFFGTNPLAFGYPVPGEAPAIIDMSTSTVARGKIILAAKQGEPIPDQWALDKNGVMTNNPHEALEGTLLPTGGAKGAALALAVEIMASVLTGAAFSPDVENIYDSSKTKAANVGHFFLLLDTKPFKRHSNYDERMKTLLYLMKSVATTGTEPIRYPGERRELERNKRLQTGIHLSDAVAAELKEWADRLGIPFPST